MSRAILKKHSINISPAKVDFNPKFLPDQSDPQDQIYTWDYRCTFINYTTNTLYILSRHLMISGDTGEFYHVIDERISDDDVIVKPHNVYSYESFLDLKSPSGSVFGCYTCHNEHDSLFYINIPICLLESPYQSKTIH